MARGKVVVLTWFAVSFFFPSGVPHFLMRYALCTATDQLLAMFRRWAIDVTNEAGRQVDAGRLDLKKKLCGFA